MIRCTAMRSAQFNFYRYGVLLGSVIRVPSRSRFKGSSLNERGEVRGFAAWQGPVHDALPFKDLRMPLLSLMPFDSRRGQAKVLHAGLGDSEPRSVASTMPEFPDFGFHIC